MPNQNHTHIYNVTSLAWLTRAALGLCLVLVAALMGGGVAQAEDVKLQNVRLGLMGQMKGERLNPVTISVVNEGKARKGVSMVLMVPRTISQKDEYRKVFDLPADSRMKVRFMIRAFGDLNEPEDPAVKKPAAGAKPGSKIKSRLKSRNRGKRTKGSAAMPFEAALFHEGVKLAGDTFFVKPLDNHMRYVYVVDEDYNRWGLKSDGPSNPLNIPGVSSEFKAFSMDETRMPYHVAEYDGADLVVLGDINVDLMNAAQRRALEKYVVGGGTLLVYPGNRWDSYRDTFLASWQGVQFSHMVPLHHNPLSDNVLPWSDVVTKEGGHWAMMTAQPGAGVQTVLSSGDIPVMVQRSMGAGRVFSCALGRAVAEQKKIGTALAGHSLKTPRPFARGQQNIEKRIHTLMGDLVGAKVPERGFVIIAVSAYLGVLAVLFLLFAKMKRLELAWFIMVPLSLIFGLVLYTVGKGMIPEDQAALNHVAVIDLPSGETHAGIYGFSTAYTNQSETVSIAGGIFDDMVEKAKTPGKRGHLSSVTYETRAKHTLTNYDIKPRQLDVFRYQGVQRLPVRVKLQTTFKDGGASVDIDYQGKAALTNAFILINRSLTPVGTIEPNAKKTVSITDDNVVSGTPDFSGVAVKDDKSIFAQSFIDTMFNSSGILAKRQLPRDRAILFAWCDANLMNMQFEPSMPGENRCLLMVQESLLASSGKITFPRGTSYLESTGRAMSSVVKEFGFGEGFGRSGMTFVFTPPVSTTSFKASSLDVFFDIDSDAFRPELEVIKPGQSGKSKGGTKLKFTNGRATVKNPAAYVDAQGRVQLKLNLRSKGAGNAGSLALSGQNQWRLRTLDIRLSGTVK